jgi:hypothetical protein
MESNSAKLWIRISLINLILVACLGILMRYKIGFEFPFFNQKNIQHAHSHFAFSAWITQSLMVLIIHNLLPILSIARNKQFRNLLIVNLVNAYLMMVSFSISGYSIASIVFSTISVLVAYVFAFLSYSDFKKLKDHPSVNWYKTAVILGAISSLGTFALAYMMATKSITLNHYLSSVYWFLHFQYNGWFFFAFMGLIIHYLKSTHANFKLPKSTFYFLLFSVFPTYGLSVLWLKLPLWVYIIVVVGTFAQTLGWIQFIRSIYLSKIASNHQIINVAKILFALVLISFTIKLSLQLGSIVPSISKLAFGYRPIVIAYLHLVLLACFSVFIIAYSLAINLFKINRLSIVGIAVFVAGVFLNEILLAIQGVASFAYKLVPHINGYLFTASLVILAGLIMLLRGQFKKASLGH